MLFPQWEPWRLMGYKYFIYIIPCAKTDNATNVFKDIFQNGRHGKKICLKMMIQICFYYLAMFINLTLGNK